MPTKVTDLDACPVESCDASISHALVTTDGTKLTTENMTQDRTCLYPTTLDGEAASYIVFHDHLEDGHAEPDVRVEESEEDEPEDEDVGEETEEERPSKPLDKLGDNSKLVFRRVMENEPIGESALAGKCITDGLNPSHAKGIAEALHRGGHLKKVDEKYVTG